MANLRENRYLLVGRWVLLLGPWPGFHRIKVEGSLHSRHSRMQLAPWYIVKHQAAVSQLGCECEPPHPNAMCPPEGLGGPGRSRAGSSDWGAWKTILWQAQTETSAASGHVSAPQGTGSSTAKEQP